MRERYVKIQTILCAHRRWKITKELRKRYFEVKETNRTYSNEKNLRRRKKNEKIHKNRCEDFSSSSSSSSSSRQSVFLFFSRWVFFHNVKHSYENKRCIVADVFVLTHAHICGCVHRSHPRNWVCVVLLTIGTAKNKRFLFNFIIIPKHFAVHNRTTAMRRSKNGKKTRKESCAIKEIQESSKKRREKNRPQSRSSSLL